MAQELYPLGVKRDGSYYMNILWASHTETNPCFWVCNVLTDDLGINGGTYACHTWGPANLVLGFFGEEQTIGRISIYKNVGESISKPDEIASSVDIFICDTDEPAKKLRTKDDDINSVTWKHIKRAPLTEAIEWEDIVLDEPVKAKYLRIDLLENRSDTIDWIEFSKVRVFEK